VTAFGELPKASLAAQPLQRGRKAEPADYRDVYFSETDQPGFYRTAIFNRTDLVPGDRFEGPAIVEQMDSTILILPEQTAEVDAYRNLIIYTFGEVDQG